MKQLTPEEQSQKMFVQYPNFRSSTYKYDPCVINKSSMKCYDCRVQGIAMLYLILFGKSNKIRVSVDLVS